MRLLRSLTLTSLLCALVPTAAQAQSDSDKATARELWQSGESKLQAHDYKGAESDFKRAGALFHAPTITLGLARAEAALGKYVEAWEAYNSIILENVTTTPAFAAALADAQAEISKVDGRRGKATITVTGADAPKVTVDDVPLKAETLGVPRFVDPGAHVLRATAEGYKPSTQSFTVSEGSAQTVTLALEKDPDYVPSAALPGSEAPSSGGRSWQKPAAFVALGVGGAGLIEGVITGIVAIGKHSDLAKACNGGCPPNESSALSSYHTMGALSTVGFIAGGALAAGGAVLLLTAPKGTSAPAPTTGIRLTPYVGFGSAGAVGTF